MKKMLFTSILVGISLFMGLPNEVYAKTESTKFFINGRERWDTEIVLLEDTTYVPLRIVSEELGAQVSYDSKHKSVLATKENQELKLNMGEMEAILNGEKVTLANKMILHTNEAGQQLAYVPLRNIFEVFDGIVDYNKEHQYVNAYNKDHITYKALQGLKSEDLTDYRFAQLALPRIGEENMSVQGGRVEEYIFPLNKKTNYFFLRIDPSGDMDVSSMAYMEIENGIAVCKWYKEVRGDKSENINPQDNTINRSLGARGITEEIGTFPTLEETTFIEFTKHSMIQPGPGQDLESYREPFNGMMGILTSKGTQVVPKHLIEEIIRSPYLSEYQVSYGDGTEFYTSYYNDALLNRVDESKIVIE